jgi:hypothetical protein
MQAPDLGESKMPYEIRTEDGKHCIYNKDTSEKKACHATREEAERQLHLLDGIEHGWKPTEGGNS